MQSEDIFALGALVGIPFAAAIVAGTAAFYLYFALIVALPAFFFAYFSDPLFAGALSQAITDTTNALVRENWAELIGDPLDPSPLASHEPSHPACRSFLGYLKANFPLLQPHVQLHLVYSLNMLSLLRTLGDALRASVDLTCLGAIYCWLFWSEGIFWFWSPTQDLYEQDRRNRRILAKLNDTLIGFAQQILRDRYRSLDRPPAATPVPDSPAMAHGRSRPTGFVPARYRSISDDSSRAVVGSDIDMHDPFFSDSSEVNDTPRSTGQSSADLSSGPEQSSRPASPRLAGWLHIELGPVDEDDTDQSPHESSSEETPSRLISPSITMSTLPSTNIATPRDNLAGDTTGGRRPISDISTDLDALLRALPTNVSNIVLEEEQSHAAGPVQEPDYLNVTDTAKSSLPQPVETSTRSAIPHSSAETEGVQQSRTIQHSKGRGRASSRRHRAAQSEAVGRLMSAADGQLASNRRNEARNRAPASSRLADTEAPSEPVKKIKVGPTGRLVDEQIALRQYLGLQPPPDPRAGDEGNILQLWAEFENDIRQHIPTRLLLPDGGRGDGKPVLFRCFPSPESPHGSMYFYAGRKQPLSLIFAMLRSLLTSAPDSLTLDGASKMSSEHISFSFYEAQLRNETSPNHFFPFGRDSPVKMLQIMANGPAIKHPVKISRSMIYTAGEPWNVAMLTWSKLYLQWRSERDPVMSQLSHCEMLRLRLAHYARAESPEDYDFTSAGDATICNSIDELRRFEMFLLQFMPILPSWEGQWKNVEDGDEARASNSVE